MLQKLSFFALLFCLPGLAFAQEKNNVWTLGLGWVVIVLFILAAYSFYRKITKNNDFALLVGIACSVLALYMLFFVK